MIEGTTAGSYDDGNKMERESTRLHNISLLGSEGQESVFTVRKFNLKSTSSTQWARGRDIIELESESGSWGFKDPRTLLTLEYWTTLSPQSRMIAIFRDPSEVYNHYEKRARKMSPKKRLKYKMSSIHAWCVYNSELLRLVQANPEILLLEYSAFLSQDEESSRLEKFLNIAISDQRNPLMRRSNSAKSLSFLSLKRIETFINKLNTDEIYQGLQAARKSQMHI